MRFALTFVAFVSLMLPATIVAAPIHIQLLGEIEAVYSFQQFGLPLPTSVVKGAPVAIDLAFEPIVLRYPGSVQPFADALFIPGSQEYISAESAVIKLLDGAVRLGEETFHWTDGKLLVADNGVGGFCAGFGCTTWTSDTIELLGWGQAPELGEGVRFLTNGGLSSQQYAFGVPPNNTLMPGTDLADLATWEGFPDSSFYLRFQSEDGSRQANVTVQLTEVIAIPEPQSLISAIAIIVVIGARRVNRQIGFFHF